MSVSLTVLITFAWINLSMTFHSNSSLGAHGLTREAGSGEVEGHLVGSHGEDFKQRRLIWRVFALVLRDFLESTSIKFDIYV